MQDIDDQAHTRGRLWHRRLRLLLAMVPLGFLLPVTDVAATTGALLQLSGTNGCVSKDGTRGTCLDGRGLNGAAAVAVSPDGRYVYVASFDSSAVAIFVRNTT